MTLNFKKLTQVNNGYFINCKTAFNNYDSYSPSKLEIEQCLMFAWNMTFGEKGHHRQHRSGGDNKRKLMDIFFDVFIGKVGECAFYHSALKRKKVVSMSAVDFACFAQGTWDDSDFILINEQQKKYKIAVKTTKHFGNLLLLETKDWCIQQDTMGIKKAIYKPNHNNDQSGIYDFFIFSRVKSNLNMVLTTDYITQFQSNQSVNIFEDIYSKLTTSAEIVGCSSNDELVHIMEQGYILPKGALLNGKIRMDAENYYIQSGCFRKL